MNEQVESNINGAQLQRILVTSFSANHIERFARALNSGADINYADEETKYSVFELVCITPKKSAFIELCIVYGGLLNKMNANTGKYPVHLAAESQDKSNLVVLLNQPMLYIDEKTRDGKTALYLLVETMTDANWNSVFECIKLLLDYHANINITSNDGKTPIQLILENIGLRAQFIKHFLMYCSMNCFLNESQNTKETMKHLYTVEIPEYTAHHQRFDELRGMLNNVADEQIIAQFQKKTLNTEEFSDEMIRKLLEVCIYRCKPQAAKQILNSMLDNGKLNNRSTLLSGLLAKCCKHGAYKILQWLLNIVPEGSRDFLNEDPLLLYVVEKMDSKVHTNNCAFFECIEILLKDPRIEIDKRDGMNCTALQMAGRCKNDLAQKLLLDNGAYIGGSDITGCHTIDEINPEVLKEHFDSCVSVSDSRLKKKDKFEVDVTNLIVPKFKSEYKEHVYEHLTDDSFHNVLLALLDLVKFDSIEQTQIILHPVISCWLHLRWLHHRPVWWAEFGLCLMFLVCLYAYLMLRYYSETSQTEWYTIVLTVLAVILGFVYMCLVIIQLWHKRIEGMRYISGWIKLVLLVSSASFLVTPQFFNEEIQRIIASFTLFCSGFVFLLTIDTVSCLSISTHILMLQVVLSNLLKCLIPCTIIVFTFAISFHMLLRKKDIAQLAEAGMVYNATESVISTDEEDFHTFKYIGFALQKTVVMMTGEFDASSMPLTYIPFGIMFSFFVLFVSIAFYNLMNGLAVSDVANLRVKSKVLGIEQKIRMLYQYEHTLNWVNGMFSKFCGLRWKQNSRYDVPGTMHRIIIKLHQKNDIDICLLREPSIAVAAYNANKNDVELFGRESTDREKNGSTRRSMRYRMERSIVRALKHNFDSMKMYRAQCVSCHKS